jgi:hypothetical protein
MPVEGTPRSTEKSFAFCSVTANNVIAQFGCAAVAVNGEDDIRPRYPGALTAQAAAQVNCAERPMMP